MNLESLRKIAAARTKGTWTPHWRNGSLCCYSIGPVVADSGQAHSDADFLVTAAGCFDQMLVVCEMARKLIDSDVLTQKCLGPNDDCFVCDLDLALAELEKV